MIVESEVTFAIFKRLLESNKKVHITPDKKFAYILETHDTMIVLSGNFTNKTEQDILKLHSI